VRLKTVTDVVDWGLCVGCGACAYASNGNARMVHVEAEGFRPIFVNPGAASSGELLQVCPGAQIDASRLAVSAPTKADREFGATLEIWEGWATDPEIRYKASSGGVLTALSLYCLEREGFAATIHAGMDPQKPWMNRNHVSRNRLAIMAHTGSRYAPSAPVAGLSDIGEGRHVFVGKPCDTAAVSELRRRDAELDRKIGLVLTFFCAGTPSTRGTLDLMREVEGGRESVAAVHYRGEGWPGDFRVLG
jgi:coenzyme F420 hydrogenase subunit beta